MRVNARRPEFVERVIIVSLDGDPFLEAEEGLIKLGEREQGGKAGAIARLRLRIVRPRAEIVRNLELVKITGGGGPGELEIGTGAGEFEGGSGRFACHPPHLR